MKNRHPFYSWALILLLFASFFSPLSAQAQENPPPPEVTALIERMTPEERIGQLFLISVDGDTINREDEEEALITTFLASYPVGGVILNGENDNFSTEPENAETLYQLTADLQEKAWDFSKEKDWVYIPLFMGISQEDQALIDLSPQPSPMAIGATWNPELATQNGAVLGKELSALGINLYLGPSLDILEDPNPANNGDIGIFSFGGNPYWVSEMGKAFISGLHTGSENKILVVTKHFPGSGNADRLTQEEIVTIRKSAEELEEVELVPFSVTTRNFSDSDNADGLLIPHIRYEAFQGNIRPTTRPISLDEKSLSEILTLSPVDEWRQAGGLTISDDLGSRAIRDFYAPDGNDFSAHLVARDAFLAGNDLLYMGNIISSDTSNA